MEWRERKNWKGKFGKKLKIKKTEEKEEEEEEKKKFVVCSCCRSLFVCFTLLFM